MLIYEDWKKELEEKLNNREQIPITVQRCPKCKNLSLEFDADHGRIFCRRCGFEEFMPMFKKG